MQIQERLARCEPSPTRGMVTCKKLCGRPTQSCGNLLQQRAEVMRRIGTIKQTIAGLANLFGDEVFSDELLELVDRKSSGRQPGFTKACRMILMDANRALSARDVCDRIQERAPPMLARHKDPMASVTTVLNRLVAYGEARGGSSGEWPPRLAMGSRLRNLRLTPALAAPDRAVSWSRLSRTA